MTVYKLDDIIVFNFLRVPKALFANAEYIKLSSDAKLTYALLYDRLSLSQQNGWINANGEVYLHYTREAISKDLGISYKKATNAFRELVKCGLIMDKRQGQGKPNKIYIVKPEVTVDEAREFTNKENSRTAEMGVLRNENESQSMNISDSDTPKWRIKRRCSGRSRTAKMEHQDAPKQRTNKTNITNTDFIYTEFNHSINGYNLNDILLHCEIDLFDSEKRKLLSNAVEQMFYCKELKVGKSIIPGDTVRSRLYELTHEMLEDVISKLHRNKREIKNRTGYIMSVIYNSITEDISILHTDPYLNSLREGGEMRCT